MHCNMGFNRGLSWALRLPFLPGYSLTGCSVRCGRVVGFFAFFEADLPRARERFRMFLLQEIDELFAHLTAQIESLCARAGTHQATQLHGAFLEVGDLQGGNLSIPFVRLFEDLEE